MNQTDPNVTLLQDRRNTSSIPVDNATDHVDEQPTPESPGTEVQTETSTDAVESRPPVDSPVNESLNLPIKRIREAEEQALSLIESARQEAQQIVAKAREDAKTLRTQSFESAKAEADAACDVIVRQGNTVIQGIEAETDRLIGRLKEQAQRQHGQAVATLIDELLT